MTARRAWIEQVMGLPVSVHVRGDSLDDPAVEARVAAVYTELREADARFSPYQPGSEVSLLHRGELAPDLAGPELREVFRLCELARERTGGAFDARALPLPSGGVGFDPSGLVKGWAVERAFRHLRDLDAHVNAGGDIIAGSGRWRAGIEDPRHPGALADVVVLRRAALATSGTAARGAHIMDPRSRTPATSLLSASVTGPELLWADVYATAAMVQGTRARDLLDEVDGYEALLIDSLGRTHATAAWPSAG